jgi:hypothetical protein
VVEQLRRVGVEESGLAQAGVERDGVSRLLVPGADRVQLASLATPCSDWNSDTALERSLVT